MEIATARQRALDWLAEHSPAKPGASGHAVEIRKPQFQGERDP
jgi:hypothetical protein